MTHQLPEAKAEINVTPLVDVVLVLLIIFMVVTPVITTHGIHPPLATLARQISEQDLVTTISLTADGDLFWEESLISKQALADRLQELQERQPGSRLLLRADRRLQYGAICSILDLASAHGFHDLSLATERAAAR